jgi:hypothetical protein
MPNKKKGSISFPLDKEEIIKDYRIAYQSRQASIIGCREALSEHAPLCNMASKNGHVTMIGMAFEKSTPRPLKACGLA